MKRIILSVLTMSALLCGCQKDHVSELAQGRGTIQATIEDISGTRTVMDENNNIRWSEGDQIVGFMKSTLGVKYQVTAASVGKTSASFEEVSSGGLNAGTELEHIIAYYPYSSSVSAAKSGSNYTLDVVLPTEQTYVAESFGNGSMAMVAVSENNNITFRNVLGGMKLQLKGTQKVASIKVEGKNGELLSGAATVTAYTDETKPAITMASGASASVTLDCGSGVQLNESKATEFIVVLPPVLFSQGFTVTIKDTDDNEHTVETSKVNEVIRSSLLTMPDITIEDCTENSIQCWVDLGLNVLWASYNVGADSPEDYGGYFAWGETTEKSSYTLRNYLYYNTQTENFEFLGTDIKETVYDAASTVWGDGARMPNKNDVEDLINHCSFEYGTYNNVKGVYAIGPNRNRIFIPFCGSREDSSLYGEGQYGDYWCSTHEPGGGSDFAYGFTLRETSKGIGGAYSKYYGHSIRAVKDKEATHTNDYIDEYGINHGKGVEISGVVWAPVNCGYHKTDFKYGKLYQWGRKYGQGYDNADVTFPEIVEGPVSLSIGQSKDNEDKFFYSPDPGDWCEIKNDYLWNSATESNPVKTEYDPCPDGWRVPTYTELNALYQNRSTWICEDGQTGYRFSGKSLYSDIVSQVFLESAGYRYNYTGGEAKRRGENGAYWSSRKGDDHGDGLSWARLLSFSSDHVYMADGSRANAYSVRCVRE